MSESVNIGRHFVAAFAAQDQQALAACFAADAGLRALINGHEHTFVSHWVHCKGLVKP